MPEFRARFSAERRRTIASCRVVEASFEVVEGDADEFEESVSKDAPEGDSVVEGELLDTDAEVFSVMWLPK
jgi:hypothetical protein